MKETPQTPQTPSLEQRILSLYEQAREVLATAKAELSRRVVYLDRARLLSGILADAIELMLRAEALALPDDFNVNWYLCRRQLEEMRTIFRRIISGSADREQPCRANHS